MFFRVLVAVKILRSVAGKHLSRVRTTVILLVTCLLLNAVCFWHFESSLHQQDGGLSFLDSVYFSIVSMTTIGYGDYYPQTLGGRLSWFLLIVIVGLGLFTYLVGLGVDFFVQFRMREIRGMNAIHHQGHIIVVNFPSEARVQRMISEFRADPASREQNIVIVADNIEGLPWQADHVRFVRGPILEEETYGRANLAEAASAIVLATRLDDPRSDGIVASIISVIKGLRQDVPVIGECLSNRHEKLFRNNRCDHVVLTDRIATNVLVHEGQDSGVSEVIADLTGKTDGSAFYSAPSMLAGHRFADVARALFEMPNRIIPVAILRGSGVLSNPPGQEVLGPDDRIIYISDRREDWHQIGGEIASRIARP